AIFRRAAIVLLALNLPAALSGALIHDLPGVLQFEQACNTALLVELLVWATLAWRAGQRSARFYTIAFAGVFVGVVVNRLALDQYIPHVAFTEWIFEIGILWEVVWLARAVAGYLNDTARENALLHAAESQLQYLVNVDGLTGVANRRGFDERLEVEWKRAARARTNLSLLLVDVDHFKQFNDSCGHVAGDDCLRAIARTLAAGTSRASDFCARYGGEEFAVLAAGVTAEDARQLGERLRQDVLELAIPHGGLHGNAVTISVGVATCTPAAGSEPADLVAAADSALYDAKRGGRNAVVERAMA
ncbi:MAG: diguanylate cyclase, partial [Candidatus Eremiobacteraeota bacterium]|nr:diguanylate cyclase [Candidatus Eremiobacteraeota bacterium]